MAEAGILERQAILLCASIRRFSGRYAGDAITVIQPRNERKISPDGRARFRAMGAEIVEIPVVSPCPEYGTSFRVLACAAYEPRSTADLIIFMDSDTLVLAEPDLDLRDADVALRPVDVKGMGTSGPGDAHDSYWRELCHLCGVDYESLPHVTPTVEPVRIRASYNGGLTVVKKGARLFETTADFFLRAYDAGLVPWPDLADPVTAGCGRVSLAGSRYWGSAQAALSVAIRALGLSARILPPTVNFPLHYDALLRPGIQNGTIPMITHVHYHHLLREYADSNPIMAGMPGFPPCARVWLREQREDFA